MLTARDIAMGRTGGDGESTGRNSVNEQSGNADGEKNGVDNSVEALILAKLAATRLARQKIAMKRQASKAEIVRNRRRSSAGSRAGSRTGSRSSNGRRSADGGSLEGQPNTVSKGGFSTIGEVLDAKRSVASTFNKKQLKPPSASSADRRASPISRLSLPGEIEDPEEFELPVTPSSRLSGDGSARLGKRQSPEGNDGKINEGYEGDEYGEYDEEYDGEYDENYEGEYDENYDGEYDENYDENYEGEYDENYDGEYDENYYEEDEV